jgi:hypothetical protein
MKKEIRRRKRASKARKILNINEKLFNPSDVQTIELEKRLDINKD